SSSKSYVDDILVNSKPRKRHPRAMNASINNDVKFYVICEAKSCRAGEVMGLVTLVRNRIRVRSSKPANVSDAVDFFLKDAASAEIKHTCVFKVNFGRF